MPDDTLPDFDLTKLDNIQNAPLIIAIAGHANHGKTSVVRTLCRLPEFGEVRDFPGVTKLVSGVKFKIVGKTYLIMFDTPGFQNSTQAIEHCGDQFKIDDIRRFFADSQEFNDDLKALDQVISSQVVLYVIDGTCEPTESLKCDFRLLARSGVPVIPMFNFTKNGTTATHLAWTDFLHHNNYHLEVKYDAHFYRPEHEHDLYEKVRVLLKDPLHRTFFDWHVAWRKTVEQNMAHSAIVEMAEMLLDCSTYCEQVSKVDSSNKNSAEKAATDRFVKAIARRESQGFQKMVAAYQFKPELLEQRTDPAERNSLWKAELFGNEIKRHLGIGVAGGASAGFVSVGFVDLLTAGHLLGVPTLIGTIAGAVLGAFSGGLFNSKWDRASHSLRIESTEKMRRALVERSLQLLKNLQHRGMADQRDFVVSDTASSNLGATLNKGFLAALANAKADFDKLSQELTNVASQPNLCRIDVETLSVRMPDEKDRHDRLLEIQKRLKALDVKVESSED